MPRNTLLVCRQHVDREAPRTKNNSGRLAFVPGTEQQQKRIQAGRCQRIYRQPDQPVPVLRKNYGDSCGESAKEPPIRIRSVFCPHCFRALGSAFQCRSLFSLHDRHRECTLSCKSVSGESHSALPLLTRPEKSALPENGGTRWPPPDDAPCYATDGHRLSRYVRAYRPQHLCRLYPGIHAAVGRTAAYPSWGVFSRT